MKTSVLFVDDEENVLSGLRRMLRHQRSAWDIHFASGGAEAIELMATTAVDVIVSDMRMPGIDGAELLTRVATLYPHCIRLVLSGQSEHEKIFRAVGPAHQFLSKPCDADRLVKTIERACGLFSHLHDKGLQEIISRIDCLPSLPKIYHDLVRELQSDDTSVERVAAMIGNDLGMSSKVLQLVNSSFFGLPHHVTCPKHAVSLLGLNVIRPLTLSAGTFSKFEDPKLVGYSLSQAIDHALVVGLISRNIAESETKDTNLIDDAFIAGMMHDIGKLILAVHLPERFQEALTLADETEQPLWRAEMAVLGTTHAAVGAHLLGLWGLPNSIVEAVALHHQPSLTSDDRFSPLTAVHMANAIDHQSAAKVSYRTEPAWDEDYFEAIGCGGRSEHWLNCVHPQVTA
ncbi:response regulator [Neorhodopirellula pilleata]|uniref:Hydrogenase transcriptional regulatory protein hupR1 n=1 Tax=Neorhodopirellula pilleata TaxID=2714738 RepID=A0A5C6A4F8_9BACT|nr:response regulator [Neorhodopirellula pilleata]TWT94326.1 Hydrogenase transcriptional regulatory protein hupR1 [Neorhodopirellula pilleata]